LLQAKQLSFVVDCALKKIFIASSFCFVSVDDIFLKLFFDDNLKRFNFFFLFFS